GRLSCWCGRRGIPGLVRSGRGGRGCGLGRCLCVAGSGIRWGPGPWWARLSWWRWSLCEFRFRVAGANSGYAFPAVLVVGGQRLESVSAGVAVPRFKVGVHLAVGVDVDDVAPADGAVDGV